MSRVQLALRVADLESSIAFYSTLFHTTVAKRRPGYANFAITTPPLKLVLLEGEPGQDTRMDHLGVEVESTELVHAAADRLAAAGLTTRAEEQSTCCYAVQDKVWVTGPGQEPWEVYTVTADARPDLEGRTQQELSDVGGDGTCCTTTDAGPDPEGQTEQEPSPVDGQGTCCTTTEAETCCEPDAKSSCCGEPATSSSGAGLPSSCGCR